MVVRSRVGIHGVGADDSASRRMPRWIRTAAPYLNDIGDQGGCPQLHSADRGPSKHGGGQPPELLEQQNEVITLCQRRRSGIPKAVQSMMSVPFAGNDIIPLIRPSNLQLVRVRRQHAVDYETASRSKRPADLYADPRADSGASVYPSTNNEGSNRRAPSRSGRVSTPRWRQRV
jgi:hypothetical protein